MQAISHGPYNSQHPWSARNRCTSDRPCAFEPLRRRILYLYLWVDWNRRSRIFDLIVLSRSSAFHVIRLRQFSILTSHTSAWISEQILNKLSTYSMIFEIKESNLAPPLSSKWQRLMIFMCSRRESISSTRIALPFRVLNKSLSSSSRKAWAPSSQHISGQYASSTLTGAFFFTKMPYLRWSVVVSAKRSEIADKVSNTSMPSSGWVLIHCWSFVAWVADDSEPTLIPQVLPQAWDAHVSPIGAVAGRIKLPSIAYNLIPGGCQVDILSVNFEDDKQLAAYGSESFVHVHCHAPCKALRWKNIHSHTGAKGQRLQ